MGTVISKPGLISLSGNIEDIIVASKSIVHFSIKHSSNVLLEETYIPDIKERVTIRLRDLLPTLLQVKFPENDVYTQTEAVKDFTFIVNDTTFTSKVIFSGVDANVTASLFLKTNWLTWQQQEKKVKYNAPEWLSYYAIQPVTVKVKAYFADKSSSVISLHIIPAGKLQTLNMSYAYLSSKFTGQPVYFDVWTEHGGEKYSFTQRYILTNEYHDYDDFFVFANSLGGIDTIRFTGEKQEKNTFEIESALFDEDTIDYEVDFTKIYKKNTGYFVNERERQWAQEFFNSTLKYYASDLGFKPITISKPKAESKDHDISTHHYTFNFALSKQTKYLNLNRANELPDVVEIVDPNDKLFFLAPRLQDFQKANLYKDLIIPVQIPFQQKFQITTYGAIQDSIMQAVAEVGYVSGNEVGEHIDLSAYARKDKEVTFLKSVNINDNLYVTGNIFQKGEHYVTHAQHLDVESNIAKLNKGEPGNQITGVIPGTNIPFSGLEINRGSGDPYYLGVVEGEKPLIKLGKKNSMEAICAREDEIPDNYIVKFDGKSKQIVRERLASDYYHKDNANNAAVDWNARDFIAERNLLLKGYAISDNYISGPTGQGFKLTKTKSELDSLYVRKELVVDVFKQNEIAVNNGSIIISQHATVDYVSSKYLNFLYFSKSHPFVSGDFLKCKTELKYYLVKITAIGTSTEYKDKDGEFYKYVKIEKTEGAGKIAKGDFVFKWRSNIESRNYMQYLTEQYSDLVFDGVAISRRGLLTGINDSDFGELKGFGDYIQNLYAKGGFFLKGGDLEGNASTLIKANKDGIVAVIKDVEVVENDIQNHETRITANAHGLQSKVSITTHNQLKQTVSSQATNISQNATAIQLRAKKSDVDAAFLVQANLISSKVSNSTFNTLKGVVESHSTSIAQKASSIQLNAVKGELESKISVEAGKISLLSKKVELQGNSIISFKNDINNIKVGNVNLFSVRECNSMSFRGGSEIIGNGFEQIYHCYRPNDWAILPVSMPEPLVKKGEKVTISFQYRRNKSGALGFELTGIRNTPTVIHGLKHLPANDSDIWETFTETVTANYTDQYPFGGVNLWGIGEIRRITIVRGDKFTGLFPSIKDMKGEKGETGSELRTTKEIDLKNLDANKFYAVTINIYGDIATPLRLRVQRTLLSHFGVPVYSGHQSGFSMCCEWRTNASGWGSAPVKRVILTAFSDWLKSGEKVFGNIGQMANSSNEYIYLRGGSKYVVDVFGRANTDINYRTSNLTASRQTLVSPIDSVVEPVTDMSTKIGKDFIQTTNIYAENLQIKAANIQEKLTVSQIDVDELKTHIVNADTINALECDFKKGKVGGYAIKDGKLESVNGVVQLISTLGEEKIRIKTKYTTNAKSGTSESLIDAFGYQYDGGGGKVSNPLSGVPSDNHVYAGVRLYVRNSKLAYNNCTAAIYASSVNHYYGTGRDYTLYSRGFIFTNALQYDTFKALVNQGESNPLTLDAERFSYFSLRSVTSGAWTQIQGGRTGQKIVIFNRNDGCSLRIRNSILGYKNFTLHGGTGITLMCDKNEKEGFSYDDHKWVVVSSFDTD